MDKKHIQQSEQRAYPPVVTVLGHVDHGKTTLLDTIRKTSIAQKEHGGITQKIGASSVTIVHDGKKHDLTFIDTPGHEAFTKMRSRGAQAADVGLLIVSAVDGVMPQTKESIALLKGAQIPFIVVLTKSDVEGIIIEKVKQQLLREEVMLEGYGGDVPYMQVSAKTGHNIKELLDLIILVSQMHPKTPAPVETAPLLAIIIESRLDAKVGPRATAVIKNGTLAVRDTVLCEDIETRVRSLVTDAGVQVKEATIGMAVEILGFTKTPAVGSIVQKKHESQQVQKVEEEQKEKAPYSPDAPEGMLSVIVCADTVGSLEAIIHAFPKGIYVVQQKTGEITEADVLLAKSTGALVLGFNTGIKPQVMLLARQERVLLKNYTIIYEMLDEIGDVLEGKKLAMEEKIFGKAKILASFPFDKTIVLGVKVLEGRIAKGDKIRIERNKETIGESTIVSVRQGKNTVSKVENGNDAGMIISPTLDFAVGDMVLSHD